MLWLSVSGRLGHHDGQRVPVAAEVRYQHLDLALRQPLPDLPDALGEDERAAVGKVVTVHRRDDGVLQPHLLHALRQAPRLVEIEPGGLARRDGAICARPRADVAQYHERSRPPLPASADVGAVRLLAHRMQTVALDEVPQLQVVRPARHPHLHPPGQPPLARASVRPLVQRNDLGSPLSYGVQ